MDQQTPLEVQLAGEQTTPALVNPSSDQVSADDAPSSEAQSKEGNVGRSDTAELQLEKDKIRSCKIMIVDDEQLVIRVVRRFLASDGYSNFVTITDPREAMKKIQSERPDVILLDIMMPHLSGIDILKRRQSNQLMQHIPFIILSGISENEIKREALKLGATDFLSKPVDPVDLVLRVQNALIVKRHLDHLTDQAYELERKIRLRTEQIERSREQIIHCLARAAEYRDNETGEHVIRVGKYARVIAKQLGFGPNYCRCIELAAQLHDVGKIGIPDAILLNPAKLTADEFDQMKKHCELGCQIMEPLVASKHNAYGEEVIDSTMLALAARIAKTHHEKWDGTGYPMGLKGEEIPIEGRITCVADVYDALCSKRPYKEQFPVQKCLEIMLSERGTRFDPQVLDAFFAKIDDIEKIRQMYNDGTTLIENRHPTVPASS